MVDKRLECLMMLQIHRFDTLVVTLCASCSAYYHNNSKLHASILTKLGL